jgi:hypothetical protein
MANYYRPVSEVWEVNCALFRPLLFRGGHVSLSMGWLVRNRFVCFFALVMGESGGLVD